ncbi:hypothetical protein [Chryseobacterium sp. FDAARGOS 1104]|uniref:RHS repeat-associated core domain n=2 Tax=Chryseobacterium taihuense TaxID=1141221 RepID=A0A4U8WDP7_9FLAO|nr:hypothetical protein [Chryseobacterium sp. FDAARGOS 1104]QQV02990.1 hypothetical protein I6I61_01100 [Chryseobacterium sp. FDAARGOS 1104]VFB03726.1 RHS repeat-associated core domain [Chryseobacterium taihuense]
MLDLGRWGVVDPLVEVTPHLSPYHYANNNPLMYNDPKGMLSQSFIDAMWNSSPDGATTTWYNTGSGFVSSMGGAMDYDGHCINWSAGYTNSLLAGVGAGPAFNYIDAGGAGGGGGVAGEILIPEVTVYGRAGQGFGLGTYNSLMMERAFENSAMQWNLSQAKGSLYDAIANTKVGQSVTGFENFLFKDVPQFFVGGSLFNAGWKAIGAGKYLSGITSNLYSRVTSRILANSANGGANLAPLGLVSTGRTVAGNLVEQMAMKDAMANPQLGTRIMEGMKDSRWLGWTKMEYKVKTANGVNAVIHYVAKWKNGVLKAVDDFKFK